MHFQLLVACVLYAILLVSRKKRGVREGALIVLVGLFLLFSLP
jgi:hypothetical protein